MTLTFESFLTGFFAVMSTVILLGWTFGRQKALSIFKKEKTRKDKKICLFIINITINHLYKSKVAYANDLKIKINHLTPKSNK